MLFTATLKPASFLERYRAGRNFYDKRLCVIARALALGGPRKFIDGIKKADLVIVPGPERAVARIHPAWGQAFTGASV